MSENKPFYKNKKVILVVIGVLLLIGIASAGEPDGNDLAREPEDKGYTVTDTDTTVDDPMKYVKDGDIVEVGTTAEYQTINLKIDKVSTDTTFVSYGTAYNATKGSKYLVIELTATNKTNMPFNFPEFILISSSGKAFQPDTSPAAFGDKSLFYQSLSPDVPTKGYVLFVIPDNVNEAYYGSTSGTTEKFTGTKLAF